MSTVTEPRRSSAGLLLTAVLAVFVPPWAFAVSFIQVVRYRNDRAAQRPWVWVMVLAWVGLALWVLFFAQH
jgi:uncharacterized membrane-anchored protein